LRRVGMSVDHEGGGVECCWIKHLVDSMALARDSVSQSRKPDCSNGVGKHEWDNADGGNAISLDRGAVYGNRNQSQHEHNPQHSYISG
jgi:hypothetical protein